MFNLINILGQNTLPEQVEVNKQNIAILADEVEKLGYQPKGEYSAETEYNHNDVVFYDNKLYVVTSDAAIVGVLPTNTTYWQQVTGDIRGQQGATGAPGPAGADGTNGVDGTDGKPVLWYNQTGLLPNIAALNALLTESSHSFTKAYFSRVGDVGDEFIYFIYIADSKTSFALIYKIATWPEGVNSCTAVYQNVYASMTGQKGDKGATGKSALVYDETIPFSRGESSIQLIEQALPFANFNRTPELNEDFIAILHDTLTLKDYIANVEVQTINSGSQVVSACVASNIALITGADGQNGTNGTDGTDGTDGKDALVYGIIDEKTYDITAGVAITGLAFTNFNREPAVNDKLDVVCKNTSNGKSFIATGYISEISSVGGNYFARMEVVSAVETTGAQGASSQLYEHKILITHSGNSTHALFSFISQDNTPINTLSSLANLLRRTLGETQINGIIVDASSNYNQAMIIFYSEADSAVAYRYERSGTITGYALLSTAYIYTDTVRAI